MLVFQQVGIIHRPASSHFSTELMLNCNTPKQNSGLFLALSYPALSIDICNKQDYITQ
jgi:hypothetical protein